MANQHTTRSSSLSCAPTGKITGAGLVALRERYCEYMAQLQAGDCHLLTFNCPECGQETRTLAPEKETCWDSTCTCPWCGVLYVKLVQHNKVEVFRSAAYREVV